jgi:hypothetical protein
MGEAGGWVADDGDDRAKGVESTAGLSDFSGPWPGDEEAMNVGRGIRWLRGCTGETDYRLCAILSIDLYLISSI